MSNLVVSIHAPWEGCDLQALSPRSFSVLFQFTHPGKGATDADMYYVIDDAVSIHAPWEGCDEKGVIILIHPNVSIHAPWEGCDSFCLYF